VFFCKCKGPNREDIEKIFVFMQMKERAHIKLTNSVEETARYVSQVTQAIAFEPYRYVVEI
jgi:hypothetical protein